MSGEDVNFILEGRIDLHDALRIKIEKASQACAISSLADRFDVFTQYRFTDFDPGIERFARAIERSRNREAGS